MKVKLSDKIIAVSMGKILKQYKVTQHIPAVAYLRLESFQAVDKDNNLVSVSVDTDEQGRCNVVGDALLSKINCVEYYLLTEEVAKKLNIIKKLNKLRYKLSEIASRLNSEINLQKIDEGILERCLSNLEEQEITIFNK